MKRTPRAAFRHPATIVADGEAIGAGGVIDKAVTSVCTTRAAIWPTSAREARENMREGVTVTHNIRIDYRPGINETMRVLFDGRSFEIKGIVNPEEANLYLDLLCEELK
ncbi:phage head-tail adaptor, putative, SPP1 family [Desulfuromonas thiophila]|uniref:Phage head-tail adaptor, putative, SPP1 family n=1 Tax=Desulfuromonas thiophila TaxID=57664 RepID=A0A1G7B1F7_9BACT|nr:phage head-tail adaptor, putative, SPP1 family [Desulfuromonas thiophila]